MHMTKQCAELTLRSYVGTVNTGRPNPNHVIPQTAAGAMNSLIAAAKEASVKQFVYDSSVATVAMPMSDAPFHIGENDSE
ncbi:uncharacterized protein Z518_00537 [Rhinocladiella mackenziei CBS 650.93]|uniref:3-beta hydroxysteroid dehydrogenase/isomerase domain-containing protein n=1 Tax=Rhinocladiella mackenziei CBS 650.93 TaxID=1442369 RepID=A0A0D2G478_9EURO|nr:uncharacterized protein Z518_00537 [Rhinocladiella mackenziei CBS 650.93]KIX09457.1 hypothetical protein Z518_00537 [Rhinocladiella mackenziei CBS 650.93]